MNDESEGRESANKYRDQLREDFNAWTSILTAHSLQATFAVVAANWAVYGSAGAIISNTLAKFSIGIALSFLGINLAFTLLMGWMHRKQYYYAEENHDRWTQEYLENKGQPTPWPYTPSMERLGIVHRHLKAWAPLVAAALFVISILRVG